MKRAISSTCLAAAFAAGLSAHAPTPSPSASAPAQPQRSGASTVTITGCLRPGDAPGSFVLANVKSETAQGSTAESASIPSTAPAPAGTSGGAVGAPGTATTSGTTGAARGLENSTVGLTGAPTARAAVEDFLNAVKAQDIQAMSVIFGTKNGPSRDNFGR